MKISKLFLIMILMMLITFSFFTTALASDKEYNINSVNIFVEINKDGSATILENWNVTYEKGDFSRLYKTICYEDREDKFSSLSTLWVKIDGEKCEYTEDIEKRPDNHYSLVKKGSSYTYSAYLKSSDVTRNNEFCYVLNDVIKLVNNKNYIFNHQFFSEGFEKNIDELNIYVYTPESKDSYIRVINSTSENYKSGNKAEIKSKNVDDFFGITLQIEKFKFDKLSKESHIIKIDTYPLVWMIHILMGIVFVVFIMIRVKKLKVSKLFLIFLMFIPLINIVIFMYMMIMAKKMLIERK